MLYQACSSLHGGWNPREERGLIVQTICYSPLKIRWHCEDQELVCLGYCIDERRRSGHPSDLYRVHTVCAMHAVHQTHFVQQQAALEVGCITCKWCMSDMLQDGLWAVEIHLCWAYAIILHLSWVFIFVKNVVKAERNSACLQTNINLMASFAWQFEGRQQQGHLPRCKGERLARWTYPYAALLHARQAA